MTDAGRKDFSSKVHDTVKPDSQKSLTEQAGDKLSGAADSVSGTLQPEGQKSHSQKAGDTVSGTGENKQGIVDKTKDTLGLNK